MKKNMGTFDRIARTAVAAGIAGFIFGGLLKGTAAVILGVLAVVFLVTSAVGICPLYSLLGFRTRRGEEGKGPTRIDV